MALVGVVFCVVLLTATNAVAACGNAVSCENALPGDSPSDWQVNGSGDASIQGFATSMSVNVGQTISFKIKTPATAYHLDILRLGYYGGAGARKVAANVLPTATLPQTQPACLTDSSTGLIDCGNWGVSASWTVPSNAVSGVYIAHLVRNDTGGDSQIPFVVRDDASRSKILLSTSDATWQAYNAYGGNSLYTCTVACPPGNPLAYKAAYAVSYNRPFDGTLTTDNGQSYLYYAEYQMIRFLEKNGYDLSYTSSSDVDARGSLLLNHKLFVSSAHDEYWSAGQRANVTAARDAGVNLAFFSGNEMFWKTRWAPDGSNTPDRTLITYKDTHFDAPTDPTTWTGTWRDPRFSPPADGGRPENGVTGQYFVVNSGTTDIQVPFRYHMLRLWRNTAAASLASGQTLTLGAGIGTLGYEWDEDPDDGFRPAGLVDMSATSSSAEVFTDYGSSTATNQPATHHLTLYRALSGALVFGAGTVQWAWGLDNTNAWGVSSTDPSGKLPDVNMQQATVNLLADMGAQPDTLSAGLSLATSSTDTTAPSSTITSPAGGAGLQDGATVTITGTASDTGGVVAGVEVSTDSGSSWHPATITSTADGSNVNWSYPWVAHGRPSTTIRSRATDDSGNLETPAAGVSVNVACPCSIWGSTLTNPADSGDASSVEVGMKFTSDTVGSVTGIRFYKAAADTGTHVGSLWSSTGQLLSQATFSGETSSGWQQVNFSAPVAITPNTTYVVSYHAPVGHYAQAAGYFYAHPSPEPDGDGSADSPPLHALRGGEPSVNGVYAYSTTSVFPANTYHAENYWVDPVFAPSSSSPPGQVTGVSATAGDAAAAVSWNAPSSGGPAASYVVTPYVGTTAQHTTTVTGSPLPTTTTIIGLTNGTTYTFTVTAVNANGSGAPSLASNAVTPQATLTNPPNGGFENGLSFWSTGGAVVPAVSSTKAHSGSSSALLGTVSGAEPTGDSWVSQAVTVPASSNATLTFWYWPASTDQICSGAACVYDWQEAQIRSTAGATLASVFKGNSNAQAWTQGSYDMSAYAGQTVVLWFNVHQDGSSPPDDTSMYLDDVALNVSAASAPAAPTNVSATAGNGSATVNWTAPANGGNPITSYTVTPYVGTVAQTATTISGNPPVTSATITGLTNGTAYTFKVKAANAIGTGPASSASNAVTPSATTVTPAFVQQVSGHALGVTNRAVTPASNITAGNRLVVLAGVWSNNGATAQSVGDSAGNSYTEVLRFNAADNTEESVWTAPITAGGASKPTITVTPTSRADVGVAALEYSGLSTAAGTGAIDRTSQNTGRTASAATVSSGATPATTAGNELALGSYVDSGFGDALTAGSGFTSRTNVSRTSDMEFLVEDQLAALGATPNANVGTGANTTWLMSTVILKHG